MLTLCRAAAFTVDIQYQILHFFSVHRPFAKICPERFLLLFLCPRKTGKAQWRPDVHEYTGRLVPCQDSFSGFPLHEEGICPYSYIFGRQKTA